MRLDRPLFLIMLTLLTVGPVEGESNSDNTLVVGEMFDITSDALDPVEDGSVLAEKALITEPLIGVNPDLRASMLRPMS